MPAPTFSDGADSGIADMGVPSVPLLLSVTFVSEFVGLIGAGLLYLVIVAGISIHTITSAKYWNGPYTAGYVLTGVFMWFLIPSVIPQIIPPIFGYFGAAVVFTSLLVLAWQGVQKF
ncbi:hypothetical protein [Halobacterium hubeiense]|uniref:hypothetical protein n=1 Tax=Halobacterium hubeiense TaxID=1407499 RepID=UPI00117AA703|nr:hypothetical protein [Halobacterium hubeiense]